MQSDGIAMPEKKGNRKLEGPFVQLPYSLWTYPGLSVSERWLCATIMRLCWKPGPQPLSLQRLAKEAGLTAGALSPGHGEKPREGLLPHLEREALITVSRPVDEHGHIQRGKPFLIEPTNKLWQLNTSPPSTNVYSVNTQSSQCVQESVYSVNSGVYQVNTPVYDVNTTVYSVNTGVYPVNTQEAITQGQQCDEIPPNIYIDNIYKEDKIDSLVVSAHAENNGDTSLSLSSSLEEKETQLVEVTIPEGDHILIERLPDGQKKIKRASGKPIGELIPVGMDVQEGLQALISIEGTLEEGVPNGNAPQGAFQRAEVPEERRVSALPSGYTREAEGKSASTSSDQDTIPEHTPQEQITQGQLTQLETNTVSTHKTQEKGNSKLRKSIKECSPEIQARRRTWQDFYNQRRGRELLPGKGERIDESKCIADLVDLYTDAQLQAIDTFVTSEIFPHKLPINTHKVGARVDFNEAQNAREVLKERGKWPGQQTPPKPNSFVPEEYDAEKEFGHWIGINELGRSPSHAAAY